MRRLFSFLFVHLHFGVRILRADHANLGCISFLCHGRHFTNPALLTLGFWLPTTTQRTEKIHAGLQLTTAIAGVSAQITKAQDEILGKIAALETALIDVDLPEDAVAAIEALRGQAQVLDDIVPDVVPEPEPIETVEPVTE